MSGIVPDGTGSDDREFRPRILYKYFKSPQHPPTVFPEHDLSIRQTKLKNTVRWLMGKDQITHLGL